MNHIKTINKNNHLVRVKNIAGNIPISIIHITGSRACRLETYYTGTLVVPHGYDGVVVGFFCDTILNDFGEITTDELLDTYPEYIL